MVEILTCRRALELAAEINVRKLHLKTDNKTVALMLKSAEKNLVVGPRVEEIKAMFRFFQEVTVSWVGRSANSAAHKFARVSEMEDEPKMEDVVVRVGI
ncbi:hypothetical protein ZWY2020_058721 [Hordeum vulgare]|nr:hypothetical protein ZWY2020_058721 [Hordeum vulgare]